MRIWGVSSKSNCFPMKKPLVVNSITCMRRLLKRRGRWKIRESICTKDCFVRFTDSLNSARINHLKRYRNCLKRDLITTWKDTTVPPPSQNQSQTLSFATKANRSSNPFPQPNSPHPPPNTAKNQRSASWPTSNYTSKNASPYFSSDFIPVNDNNNPIYAEDS